MSATSRSEDRPLLLRELHLPSLERDWLPDSAPWRWLVVFMFFLVVYVPTMSTQAGTVTNDVRASSVAAWNLAVNQRLDLSGVDDVPWDVETPDGVYTNRFPGNFLSAVPAYAVAPGVDQPFDDAQEVPLWPASLTAAVLAAAALAVLHETLRQELTSLRARGVTLAAGLATTVWTIAADALWTHSAGVFVLALSMRWLQRERHWLAGAALGYAVTVRPTHAFTALGIGVTLAIAHRDPRRLAQIGVPAALGLGAMAAYSKALFETWLPIAGYEPERVEGILGVGPPLTGQYGPIEQVTGTLFDAYHGVLTYSPFLAICALFLAAGWRRSPTWGRAAAVGGALYWIAQLRGNRFTGGYDFFAYRLPIEPLWLATMVLACAWFRAVRHRVLRVLAAALLAASVLIHTYGAITYGTRDEPRRPAPVEAEPVGDAGTTPTGAAGTPGSS